MSLYMQNITKYKSILLAVSILGMLLMLAACTESEPLVEETEAETPTVRLVYVDWVSEIASAHVLQAVIEERLGYNCELLSVTAVSMWESVASGDQDAMVGAWLPTLQEQYLNAVVSCKINCRRF